MTTSGWFLKMYVNVLQISQFLSCDYVYQYTRIYSCLEKNGKGVWGIWTFFKIFFLQRIANKTHPTNQKSLFFRMMVACYQTQRPANSGHSPISSSWDIDPKTIIGVRKELLESDGLRFISHFSFFLNGD